MPHAILLSTVQPFTATVPSTSRPIRLCMNIQSATKHVYT